MLKLLATALAAAAPTADQDESERPSWPVRNLAALAIRKAQWLPTIVIWSGASRMHATAAMMASRPLRATLQGGRREYCPVDPAGV